MAPLCCRKPATKGRRLLCAAADASSLLVHLQRQPWAKRLPSPGTAILAGAIFWWQPIPQVLPEWRGNGGGLRPRVWLRLRAAAGGNWTPDGILQLEGDANLSLSWAHEAHPKPTLHGVVFQKLNGPLPREAATHKRQRRGGHNAAASANEGDTTKQACTGGEGRAATKVVQK